MDLDLEKLFLPAWAQEAPTANRYAHHVGGGDERPERKRDFQPGRRPPGRAQGENRGPRGRESQRPRGKDGHQTMRGDAPPGRERFEPPPPIPEVNVALVPDENGVESLARQIKTTGRAYPLFSIAQIVLQKPERFTVKFSVKKNTDGQPVQPLFVCALDETLWLSEDEVVAHVLKSHFGTFYQAERTATEPPKGTYTFVAQCGMSGTILGPPNHHDYQNQLHKLHAEKFSRMPFDMFKARVKIVRDEAVVKKWVEDQSWKIEYVCLNVPEPLKLPNMEEVEKHFRAVHKETIVKPAQEHTLSGVAGRGMRCQGLLNLARQVVEDQRHFPLQMATALSQRFGSLGLQFFKINKTVTHVSVARPSFLDLESTPVSDGIKRIIAFINAKPKCSRRQLVEALAPTPKLAVIEIQPDPQQPATPSAESAGPTPEQTALISDLHWLIHQGHVIEFADGRMDTAKKPVPKPPKPQAKAAEAAPEISTPEIPASEAVVEEQPAAVVETTPPDRGLSQTAAATIATEVSDSPTSDAPSHAQRVETTRAPTLPPAEEPVASQPAEEIPATSDAQV